MFSNLLLVLLSLLPKQLVRPEQRTHLISSLEARFSYRVCKICGRLEKFVKIWHLNQDHLKTEDFRKKREYGSCPQNVSLPFKMGEFFFYSLFKVDITNIIVILLIYNIPWNYYSFMNIVIQSTDLM